MMSTASTDRCRSPLSATGSEALTTSSGPRTRTSMCPPSVVGSARSSCRPEAGRQALDAGQEVGGGRRLAHAQGVTGGGGRGGDPPQGQRGIAGGLDVRADERGGAGAGAGQGVGQRGVHVPALGRIE